MTAWRGWKGPESHRTAPVASATVEKVSQSTPDRLRAPHGAETWFVTPADTGVTTAWDTEAEANAHRARMDPRRTVVVWAGLVAT